ncbi:MAG TPA: hypothetical protein VKE27_01670 [Candidatus Dormibacteraeota bacterium]|nr:hypothetical protein [Candidatus Dormibacteraeota bacterium]
MLDAIVAFLMVLLVAAGIVVIIGPRTVWRKVVTLRRPAMTPFFESRRPRDVNALNPRTQRVVIASGRLANWMRSHGHDDVARDIRAAAARLNGNEAAGLYALQTTLRRIRVVNITDTATHERLRALVAELRTALDDRFEQLELLPFKKS